MISEDVGAVVLSPLDNRVWVAVLHEGYDMVDGAMHASTSLRKCKRYVEQATRTSFVEDPPISFKWDQRSNGGWTCEARWPS